MFEVPHEKPEGGTKMLWIGLVVVALVAIVGGALFLRQAPEETEAAPAVDLSQADPVNDLKVNRAAMDRDPTGTRAVWTISIQNDSPYTYTNIKYEATYLDARETVIVTNEGTLPGSVGPRQQKRIADLQDILYPEGTVSFRFRLLEATPTAE
jgi:hypothetical protein